MNNYPLLQDFPNSTLEHYCIAYTFIYTVFGAWVIRYHFPVELAMFSFLAKLFRIYETQWLKWKQDTFHSTCQGNIREKKVMDSLESIFSINSSTFRLFGLLRFHELSAFFIFGLSNVDGFLVYLVYHVVWSIWSLSLPGSLITDHWSLSYLWTVDRGLVNEFGLYQVYSAYLVCFLTCPLNSHIIQLRFFPLSKF